MAPKEMLAGCPVQHALQYIGGKWQIGILWHLRAGPIRFNAIKEALPGLSEKVLTDNLRFFEQKRIVTKQVYAAVPPRVEYTLTQEGQTLLPVVERILLWGYAHLQEEKVQHDTLFTPAVVLEELEKKQDVTAVDAMIGAAKSPD